jgi:uncharacterized protein (DUF58 family)
MSAYWAAHWERWLCRRHPPSGAGIRLDRRHIYILPTGYGYTFAGMLLIMFLWSINYNNSIGFGLTFLLGAVALNNMRRCHDNLLNLQVQAAGTEPVFTGQMANFAYGLDNPDETPRYGIALQGRDVPPVVGDVPARRAAILTLSLPATRRGRLQPGRLRVSTRFPLGLFQAWSWVEFTQFCLIYPQPQGALPLPFATVPEAGASGAEWNPSSEDYAGLRGYVPGDSPRHVAWKAAARGGELQVKRFVDHRRAEVWLDWWTLAPLGAEARLSQLCQWVLKAEADGWNYGLRLPEQERGPACGDSHRHRCLEALALHGLSADAENGDVASQDR